MRVENIFIGDKVWISKGASSMDYDFPIHFNKDVLGEVYEVNKMSALVDIPYGKNSIRATYLLRDLGKSKKLTN
ncbi:MAG TPA: hypothetical protein VJH92_01010 [Candidatus Nanoarchaeia archaeon]|nr:hypothetical protein [Candidatus Nanoarchaeia archaeon]